MITIGNPNIKRIHVITSADRNFVNDFWILVRIVCINAAKIVIKTQVDILS